MISIDAIMPYLRSQSTKIAMKCNVTANLGTKMISFIDQGEMAMVHYYIMMNLVQNNEHTLIGGRGMNDYIKVGGLQVASVLYNFIQSEPLPDTGVDAKRFWSGFEAIVREMAPKNRALLEKRDELQRQLDEWHREHGSRHDFEAYKSFL